MFHHCQQLTMPQHSTSHLTTKHQREWFACTNFPNRQSWHNTYNCQIFFWWGWARRRRLCARQNWGVLRVTANAKQPVPILQKSKNRCALTIAPCPGNKALKAQCAVPVGQSNACSHFFPSLYKQRTVGRHKVCGPRRAKQCVQSLFFRAFISSAPWESAKCAVPVGQSNARTHFFCEPL